MFDVRHPVLCLELSPVQGGMTCWSSQDRLALSGCAQGASTRRIRLFRLASVLVVAQMPDTAAAHSNSQAIAHVAPQPCVQYRRSQSREGIATVYRRYMGICLARGLTVHLCSACVLPGRTTRQTLGTTMSATTTAAVRCAGRRARCTSAGVLRPHGAHVLGSRTSSAVVGGQLAPQGSQGSARAQSAPSQASGGNQQPVETGGIGWKVLTAYVATLVVNAAAQTGVFFGKTNAEVCPCARTVTEPNRLAHCAFADFVCNDVRAR
jgi:hypothetical protein